MRRALSVTDLPAVLDEIDVCLVHLIGPKHAQEQVMPVVNAGLCGQHADPPNHPVDMAIDWEERHAEREEQQDGRGLLADPVDPGQPVAGR